MSSARYLLDTHTFLWLKLDPDKISSAVMQIASDTDCEILLSAVTCWEIAIEYQLGKLPIPAQLAYGLEQAAVESGFSLMTIGFSHVQRVMRLPNLRHAIRIPSIDCLSPKASRRALPCSVRMKSSTNTG